MDQKVQTQSASRTQTLSSMDERSFFLRNFSYLIGGGVVVALLSSAIIYYSYYRSRNQDKNLEQAYVFQKEYLPKLEKGEVKPDQLVSEWNKLPNSVREQEGVFAVVLPMAKKLGDKGLYKEAASLLQPLFDTFKRNAYVSYFVGQQLAVYLEDAGEFAQAKDVLTQMTKMSLDFSKDKLYFDLARMHGELGEKDQAIQNYNYVIKNYPNSSLLRLAKILESELGHK
jgi:tetratricopeptide (TPR) repeat protein